MSLIIADFLWLLDSPINYSPYKEVRQILKLILLAYSKTVAKFLLFRAKYTIDGQGFFQAILMSGKRHKKLNLLIETFILKLNLHKSLF